MAGSTFLGNLGLVVFTGAGFLLAARRFRVPPIVAYMAGGLLLGPVAGLLEVSESIDLIAEIGIALLLFLVGTELSVRKVRAVGRVAVLGGLLQVGATFLLGLGAGLATGYDLLASSFLGLALAFSSTVVVVKLLDARGELTSTHGRIAVGILLVQDVLVAVALTVLAGVAEGGTGAGAAVRGLVMAAVGTLVLGVVAFAGARLALKRLFPWLVGTPEAAFVVSLAWCFLFIVGAELVHLSVELGAFLAGIAVAQVPRNEELQRRIHPLVSFFVAVFFVSLGVRMDPAAAWSSVPTVLALTLLAVVAKPLLVMVLVPRFGYGSRTGFAAGLTLGQISEFSVILVSAAVASGLAAESLLSVVGAVAILSIGVSAVAVPATERVRAWAEGLGLLDVFGRGPEAEETPAPPLRGHVVVVGMNTLGRTIVQRLAEAGETVLAVDTDPNKLDRVSVPTLTGSIESPAVFEEAGVPQARLVVSALQIEDTNALLTYRCRRLGVPVSIHAFDPALAHELTELGADHVMVSKAHGIREVAASIQRAGLGL